MSGKKQKIIRRATKEAIEKLGIDVNNSYINERGTIVLNDNSFKKMNKMVKKHFKK